MPTVTTARFWTPDDLDLLPDDGNCYEVVEGELFVTPAPPCATRRTNLALARAGALP